MKPKDGLRSPSRGRASRSSHRRRRQASKNDLAQAEIPSLDNDSDMMSSEPAVKVKKHLSKEPEARRGKREKSSQTVQQLEKTLHYKRENVAALRSEVEEFKTQLLAIALGKRRPPQTVNVNQNIEKHDGPRHGEANTQASIPGKTGGNHFEKEGRLTTEISSTSERNGREKKRGTAGDDSSKASKLRTIPLGKSSQSRKSPEAVKQKRIASEIELKVPPCDSSTVSNERKTEQLMLENTNLRERLEVAEARAARATETESILHETECAVANLEREIASVQSRTDEQMEKLRACAKLEFSKREDSNYVSKDYVETLLSESDRRLKLCESKLADRDAKIANMGESLYNAQNTIEALKLASRNKSGWDDEDDEDAELMSDVAAIEEEKKERIRELEDARARLRKTEDEKAVLDKKVESQERMISSLKRDMDELRKEKSDTQSTAAGAGGTKGKEAALEKLEKENNYITDRNLALGKEIDFLLKDLEYSKASLEKSEETSKRLEEDNRRIRSEKEASLEVLRNELSDVTRSKSSMETTLKNRISSLEKAHREVVATLSKRNDTIETVEGELKKNRNDYNSQSKKLEQQNDELVQLRKDHKVACDARSAATEELNTIRENIGVKENIIKEMVSRVSALEKEKARLVNENESRLASLTKELEESRTRASELESRLIEELGALKKTYQETSAKLKTSDELAASLEKNLQHSQNECLARTHELSNIERELRNTKEENSVLQTSNNTVRRMLDESEKGLKKLQVSLDDSKNLVVRLNQEKEAIAKESQDAIELMEKQLTARNASWRQLESELRNQLKSKEAVLEAEITELGSMLEKRNATIDALEKVSALQKNTISTLRMNSKQLTERVQTHVPENLGERLSKAFSDEVAEANSCAQILADEIAALKTRLCSIDEKSSRVSQLETLLKETEAVFLQFAKEEYTFGTSALSRNAQSPGNDMENQEVTEPEQESESKIKELEHQLRQCHTFITAQGMEISALTSGDAQVTQSDLNSDIAQMEKIILELRNEKQQLQDEVEASTQRLDVVTQREMNLKNEFNSIRARSNERIKWLERELADCQETISRLNSLIAEQQHSAHDNERHGEQVVLLKQQLNELQEELNTKTKRVADQGRDLKVLIDDLKRARGTNETLRKQVANMREKILSHENTPRDAEFNFGVGRLDSFESEAQGAFRDDRQGALLDEQNRSEPRE